MAVRVSSLDFQGRGVARENGQVVFISGALPGELVTYRAQKKKKRFIQAQLETVLEPSLARVEPACPYYQSCGGCALQHLEFSSQVMEKQNLWLEQLQRIGRVEPQKILAPITGMPWRYRSRTRLAVAYEKNDVSLGFFARGSNEVVNITDCLLLNEELAEALSSVKMLLKLFLPKRVDSVSLHRGETHCALALETKQPISMEVLRDWQKSQGKNWLIWLNGECMVGQKEDLFYRLPEFAVKITFSPDDFTQVNQAVNRELVATAITWALENNTQTAMDFFAGLGNFSLPLARQGIQVSALEGVEEMVSRSQMVVVDNELSDKVLSARADLFAPKQKQMRAWIKRDIWLLDPPRAGAVELLRAMPKKSVDKIVYVSCDPATLARDAAILSEKGYQLTKGRIANMFAQTAHIESVVLFEVQN